MIKELGCVAATAFVLMACGGTSTTVPGDGGGSESSTGDGGGTDGSTNDGSMSTCNGPSIDLTFTGCPTRPNCGGMIAPGTYHYTSGCIADPWARAKMLCPQLMVTEQKGTVKGCLTFTNNYATRDVAATYGATLEYPTQCLLNGTCMQLETGLKMYFPTATCMTSTGGCSCKVSSTTSSMVGVGYTTMANQVVTTNNEKWDYCAMGNMLGMQWASGGVNEPGVYSLTKQ
jgi:hypothetical protein